MPIYEFQCTACRKNFESLANHNELVRCPTCLDWNVERVVGKPRIKHKIMGENGSSTPKRPGKIERLKIY